MSKLVAEDGTMFIEYTTEEYDAMCAKWVSEMFGPFFMMLLDQAWRAHEATSAPEGSMNLTQLCGVEKLTFTFPDTEPGTSLADFLLEVGRRYYGGRYEVGPEFARCEYGSANHDSEYWQQLFDRHGFTREDWIAAGGTVAA